MKFRSALSLILLAAFCFPLFSVPNVISQTVNQYTGWHTDETITTMYGSMPVLTDTESGTTSTMYGYGTSWTTIVMGYSTTSMVLNVQQGMGCSVQAIQFTATAGQLVTGEYDYSTEAGVGPTFYVLTPSQYSSLQSQEASPGPYGCVPSDYIFSSTDAYNGGNYVSFFVPNDGTYYYVFVNDTPGGAGYPISITFVAGSSSSTGGPSMSIDFGSMWLVVGAVVVAILGFFMLRRRRGTHDKSTSTTNSSLPAQNFCTNCGTKLSLGEKFCAECGTPRKKN